MISAQKMNVAPREAVGRSDRKAGHKGAYLAGAVVVLVVAFLLFRIFSGGNEGKARTSAATGLGRGSGDAGRAALPG